MVLGKNLLIFLYIFETVFVAIANFNRINENSCNCLFVSCTYLAHVFITAIFINSVQKSIFYLNIWMILINLMMHYLLT